MTLHLGRRAAVFLPLLLAACADDENPAPVMRRDFPPLRYGYLPTISLNTQRVEVAGEFVPPDGDDEVIGVSPVNVGNTLLAMAHDRLKPVATGGVATFRILNASITRHRDTLNGMLAVRLDVSNADGGNTGFVEARVTGTRSDPIRDLRAAVYDLFKSMMSDLNVELEYQIRNKLRDWIVEPAVGAPVVPRPPDLPVKPPPGM
jgi:hypothetical protein